MKQEDWFGLGVRFTGVWCALQAIMNVLYFTDVRLGFSQMRESAFPFQNQSPVAYLLYAAGYAVLAFYFLLGTEHLTRLTFGNRPETSNRRDETIPDKTDEHAHEETEADGN